MPSLNKFKHHKYFAKDGASQHRLYPFACLLCRKAFKKPASVLARKCSQCTNDMVSLSRKFRAPKHTEVDQWNKVRYLVEHGFLFHSVRRRLPNGDWATVPYPTTLAEAKLFVVEFKDQSVALNT